MINVRTLLIAATLLTAGPAVAEISFYAGIGTGGVRLEEDVNVRITVRDQNIDNEFITYSFPEDGGPLSFEGTDVGAKAYVGVRLLPFLGLEAGYVYLGEPESDLNFTIPFGPIGCTPAINFSCSRPETSRNAQYTDEIDGWEVFAVGAWPLTDNLEIFGKAGVIGWESTFTVTNTGEIIQPQLPFVEEVTLTPDDDVETDGTDLAWGGGINYKATEHIGVRFEGTWYDIEDIDMLWMINFGVQYNF